MGVYIKGMEMPESGKYEVPIDNTKGKDKTVMSLFVRGEGGLICCGVYELVPVPPHGDLIDRDALGWSYINIRDDGMKIYTQRAIDNAPTIIPASEEGET